MDGVIDLSRDVRDVDEFLVANKHHIPGENGSLCGHIDASARRTDDPGDVCVGCLARYYSDWNALTSDQQKRVMEWAAEEANTIAQITDNSPAGGMWTHPSNDVSPSMR